MPEPKLLDKVRIELRTKLCSVRTEKTYVSWIYRFILFHSKKHPKDMGAEEIKAFINNLATNHNVSNSAREI